MFQRFGVTFLGLIGGLTAVLGLVGLYAAVAFSVTARTREMGVRMALGAAPDEAVRLVLRGGLQIALGAVTLGLPLAWAAGQLARSGFPGVPESDLRLDLLLVATTIAAVLVGSYLPARRAARLDPAEVLRWE